MKASQKTGQSRFNAQNPGCGFACYLFALFSFCQSKRTPQPCARPFAMRARRAPAWLRAPSQG
jgi:hypothetical protein